MLVCDICVSGGGIVGLSIALELAGRGASVTVLERGKLLGESSQAAAGMLAAEDPENPPQLADLARLSIARYAQFLSGVERLSGLPVPFQTSVTYQAVEHAGAAMLPDEMTPGGSSFLRLEEHSIDPRQLAEALRAAVEASTIQVIEDTSVRSVGESSGGLDIRSGGVPVLAGQIVHAMGAWSFAPVEPRKGQMLAVRMPEGAAFDYVVRTPEIYAVPRLRGPRAGLVVIGATVEDAGFSTTTDSGSLAALRAMAARFLPALGDPERAPMVDRWAGLRPATPDHLPLIGWAGESRRQVIATGHYRNGILLAPGTAEVVADLLEGRETGLNLAAFSPSRFR
jgi:glycine oxidase